MSKCGPDIISKDKEAKKVWEGRVQVSFSTYVIILVHTKYSGCLHMV